MHDLRAAVRALQILNHARLDDALGTRWALLAVAGLNQIRQMHPRIVGSDLIVARVNWSAVLDTSVRGLEKYPQFARHADAWAEDAAKNPETFNAFSSWYGFLGTPEQIFIDEQIRNGALAIRNERNQPLCAYQIYSALMEHESAASFNAAMRVEGCSFKPLSQNLFTDFMQTNQVSSA